MLKCKYCGDPILKSQNTDKTGKYHAGCKRIRDKEKARNISLAGCKSLARSK